MILSAVITRTELALPSLQLNDHDNYQVADGFDAGAVAWRREQVESPYTEGKVTIGRVRDIVESKIAIQVYGTSQVNVSTKIGTLIDAFTQDTFRLTMVIDGQTFQWQGEAADYTVDWSRERLHAARPLVAFGFLRQPVPLSGPV